jgi:NTP pyrophosphatase (non-canonical NTP hydrolase)
MNGADFETLLACVDGLNVRFASGGDPFRIITRLCEEAGELASAVNHAEGIGVKREKLGEPSRLAVAGEVRDVLTAALALMRHYHLEPEIREVIAERYERLRADGYLADLTR